MEKCSKCSTREESVPAFSCCMGKKKVRPQPQVEEEDREVEGSDCRLGWGQRHAV